MRALYLGEMRAEVTAQSVRVTEPEDTTLKHPSSRSSRANADMAQRGPVYGLDLFYISVLTRYFRLLTSKTSFDICR